ncbi:MAG: hypothetical protein AAGJ82_10020, partial [Bacteroidota bacterium]
MKNLLPLLLILPFLGLSQTTSSVNADGNLIVNGAPFFPLGYYAESFIGLEENRSNAQLLAEAGFNLLFTDHDFMDAAENAQFMDECADYGIYNMIGFYDAIDFSFIESLSGKPSLLTWCIADDAQRWTGEEVQTRETQVLAVDNTHVTSGSEWYGFDDLEVLAGRLAGMDMTGLQFYPVVTNSDGIINAYDRFKTFTELSAEQQNVPFGIIQTYRWSDSSEDARFPFPSEVRAMAYTALIAGVKGLMFYTLRDYDESEVTTINTTYPEVWNETVQIAQNVLDSLATPILLGTPQYLADATGHPDVKATTWTYEGSTYLLVVNLNQVASAAINLD